MADHVCGKECPPLENVGLTGLHFVCNFLHCQIYLFPDHTLPLGPELGLGEGASKQSPARRVLLCIRHLENTRYFMVDESRVPVTLEKARTSTVYCVAGGWVGDTDF